MEIQRRRCRDKITLGNSANSGLIARFREISVRTRVRGGPGRTRTSNQAVMSEQVSGASQRCACWPRIKFDQYARYPKLPCEFRVKTYTASLRRDRNSDLTLIRDGRFGGRTRTRTLDPLIKRHQIYLLHRVYSDRFLFWPPLIHAEKLAVSE